MISLLHQPGRRSLDRLAREGRVLVLTYDDGPGPRLTGAILDVLGAAGVRATFFVLGRRAEAHPEMLDRLAAAGHEIGSHTYDHRNAWACSPRTACVDVERGYRAIERWALGDCLFRPPYGKITPWTARAVSRRGAKVGWWTIDSGDTWPALPDAVSVADRVRRPGGGVVLLHDFDRDGPDHEARMEYVLGVTRACIHAARAEGLSIETLGSVLTAGAAAKGAVTA